MDVRIRNTADDQSIYDRNLVNFGPLTSEFSSRVCTGRLCISSENYTHMLSFFSITCLLAFFL